VRESERERKKERDKEKTDFLSFLHYWGLFKTPLPKKCIFPMQVQEKTEEEQPILILFTLK